MTATVWLCWDHHDVDYGCPSAMIGVPCATKAAARAQVDEYIDRQTSDQYRGLVWYGNTRGRERLNGEFVAMCAITEVEVRT